MNAGSDGSNPRSRGVTRQGHGNCPTASTTMSMSRVRSIETPTSALTGRPDRPSSSATVRPLVWVPAVSTSIAQRSRDDQVRRRQPGDRDRVVDRRPVPPVAVAMVDREEAHEVGEDPTRSRAEPLQPGDVGRQDERLVRDVESGHPDRDPRLEDDRGSFRVGPDVELGGGRGVARPERAAHQRDPRDPRVQRRCRPQQQGDVRQRPRGDQGHRLLGLAQERRHELDRREVRRPDRRFRQVRAVETQIAVELDRDPRLAHQRAVGTRPRRARPSVRGGSGHAGRCASSGRAGRCPRPS